MRTLLISVFYPPQNAIASQRIYAWAKYWSRAGDQVTVLTPTKDLSRSDLTPKPTEGVNVVEVEPLGLFQTLKRLVRAKAQEVGAIAKVEILTKPKKRSFLSSVLKWFTSRGLFSSTRMPDAFDLWIPRAVKAVNEKSFDVVVSSFGPYAPHVVAYFLKKRNPSLIWVCDFRDLWVSNHIYPGLPGFRWLERLLERKFVRACDFVVTVSDALATRLKTDYPGLDVRVVQNGFDPEDLLSLPGDSLFADESLRHIVYTGAIHLPTRDPSPLFAAVAALTPSDRGRLRLIFIGPNAGLLERLAEGYKVSDVVEFRDSVPRQEALRAQRDADALLFLEANYGESKDGVLTGKLFEYLSSGTPIVGIGIESQSAVGRLLTEYSAGRAYGRSIEEIKRALENLLRAPKSRQRIFNPHLKKFSREVQAAALRSMISEKI